MQTAQKRDLTGICDAIRAAQTIAMCSHVSPDGDTVGSTLALKNGLEQMGKQVTVFCQDKIPDNLSMLKGSDSYLMSENAEGMHFDLLLCVDVSDEKRMGSCSVLTGKADMTAQVDHHGTNPMYADRNYVDADASATGLIVYELLKDLHAEINREIALCLYVAVTTDTGNFSYSNTTCEALAVASELIAFDLPIAPLNRVLFRERSKGAMLLLRRALNSMKFFEDDRIAVMTLTLKDFEECGALPEHADSIVNFGIDIQGVQMSMLAKETLNGPVKMSLRAIAPYRVDDIASAFHGGGHPQAAGCSVSADLYTAAEAVTAAMIESIRSRA